jgi:hypothetical protein
MVLDSFTQYNEISYTPVNVPAGSVDLDALTHGGKGIVIKNGGYCQLVSIFEICCNIAVLCQSGGTCSITNSNTDFGNYGLWADGMSPEQFVSMDNSYVTIDTTPVVAGAVAGTYNIVNLPPFNDYDPSQGTAKPYVGQVVYFSRPSGSDAFPGPFYTIQSVNVTNGGSGYTSSPQVTFQDPYDPLLNLGGVRAQAVAVLGTGADSDKIARIDVVVSGSQFWVGQLTDPAFLTIEPPLSGTQATAVAIGYPIYYTVVEGSSTGDAQGHGTVTLDETLPFLPQTGDIVHFFQVSRIIASSHCFEYVGSGTDIAKCIPARNSSNAGTIPISANEVIMSNGGRAAYTSTDHLGNFKIGPELQINQNTGTLSGRTFEKSLFAIMTPYILAIE